MGLLKVKTQVGLYIDAETVSAAGVETGPQGPRVTGCAELSGTNVLTPNPEMKIDPLAHKIKKAMDDAGVRGRAVSLAVPSESAMIRGFEMPILPKKEEKNAIRFEAQKFVPFDMKDLYFDYEVYPDPAQKKNYIVFFACKKQWVDPLAALLLSMGIKLERVELISQSLVRAFRKTSPQSPSQAEALILPNDAHSAELIFFKGDSVLLTRRLSFSQQSGMGALDMPFFTSEVRISMDYFQDNFRAEKLSRLSVAGAIGESGARELGESLSRDLSLPVENADFLQTLVMGKPVTIAMAAAGGAGFGGLPTKAKKKINLRGPEALSGPALSWDEEKKQLQDMAVKETIGVAVALFVIHLLLSHFISSQKNQFNQMLAAYPKSQNADIRNALPELQIKTSQAAERVGFVSGLIDRRIYLTTKMNEFVKTVPAYVRMTQMRYEDTLGEQGAGSLSLHLEGYVIPTEEGSELSFVNKFVKQLSGDKDFMQGFDEIKIASTKKVLYNTRSAMLFTLECVSAKKGATLGAG